MILHQDSTWRDVDGPVARVGWIPILLSNLREINSNDIPVMSDSPLTNDPAGFGGLLAKNTSPILEYTNGDTDSAWRLRWAASNVDKVSFSFPLPPDLDFSNNLLVKVVAAMGGATDTPTLTLETFFGKGDTKVSDVSGAISTTTEAVYTITVDKTDLESNSRKTFASMEFTPGTHGTDTLLIYALWIEYVRK